MKDYTKTISVYIHQGRRTTKGLETTKWSKFGTLTFYDSRFVIRKLYTLLLDHILSRLPSKENVIWAFLRGVAEGDASPQLRYKPIQGITFYLQKQDSGLFNNLCKIISLNPRIWPYKRIDYAIFFHYKEIVELLHQGLFHNYPKRREKSLLGIKNHVATRILLLLSKFRELTREEFKQKDWGATQYLWVLGKETALVDSECITINQRRVKITPKGYEMVAKLVQLLDLKKKKEEK
jgi:hypothetical protein